MATGIQRYRKLEHRLVLLAWLNHLLGYQSNREMLADMKEVAEGFASDGHSHLYHHLLARGSKVKIPEQDLARYDDNIRAHLERINRRRPQPIILRYFQHLAALYTEIFLDRLFNHKPQFLADLNGFVAERNAQKFPGIPKDDLDKIWAAFYTTKGSGHAGLGLSACLQIVKQLDGRVAAFNGPDGGAVFELLLPVAPPAPAAELPSGLSILLVDDDDGWSRFAQDVLQKAGNRVTRSADGQIDPAPFDLILLDDVLESADSVAVLRRLAATGPKTIVVSSGLMVERAVELVQSGAQDVVLKPYTLVEMAEVVGV